MREQSYAYYAVEGDDGHPRVCHAVLPPDGAVEITKDQAIAISAAMRAREVKPPAPAGYVTREEFERVLASFAKDIVKAAGAA